MRLYSLVLMFILVAGIQVFAQNADLKVLAEEDQASRLGTREATRTDDDRVKVVLEMVAKGAVQTPEDKFNAALVLQHTPAAFCGDRIVSKSFYNYLLAYYLAKEAYEAGYNDARTLVAQTIDRYLSFTEGRQKYGTNRFINQKTGKEELVPIDRSTSDSERARYGVRPLAELLKSAPEQKINNKAATHKRSTKIAK